MKKQEKVNRIRKILNQLYPHPPIPLYHTSPYTLLIAVVLSARTTDAQVNRVTPALFAKATTPQEMLELSELEILQLIRPCGLSPQKAKSIRRLSEILIEKYGGMVPQTFADLESLPGVGHKTASVILSQAFNEPAFPVDTHIHRSAKRWGLSKGRTVKETEKDLKRLFPEKEWKLVHLQIIYFAREYCPARGHIKKNCPICSVLFPTS